MGWEKAWLPWNGQTLLSHVVETVRPLVPEVLVVARPGQTVPTTTASLVTDRIIGAGPLGGLEAGLAAMRTPYGLVVACDMPWLSQGLLQAMMPLVRGYDLVIPCVAGRYQPLHAIYAKRLQPVVATLLAHGERRIHALVGHVAARVLDESFLRADERSRRSIDSVDTWCAYQMALGTGGGNGDLRRRRPVAAGQC